MFLFANLQDFCWRSNSSRPVNVDYYVGSLVPYYHPGVLCYLFVTGDVYSLWHSDSHQIAVKSPLLQLLSLPGHTMYSTPLHWASTRQWMSKTKQSALSRCNDMVYDVVSRGAKGSRFAGQSSTSCPNPSCCSALRVVGSSPIPTPPFSN